jgi:hypothetical protein
MTEIKWNPDTNFESLQRHVADLEDAIIVYHLKSPPRLTPEEQAAEDQRVLEERQAWVEQNYTESGPLGEHDEP